MTSIAFSFLLLCIRFLFFISNFTCVLLRKAENKGSSSILCSLKEPRILSMHRKCNLFFPVKLFNTKYSCQILLFLGFVFIYSSLRQTINNLSANFFTCATKKLISRHASDTIMSFLLYFLNFFDFE